MLLDVFSIPRDPASGRRVAFLTGCHECGLLFANPLPTGEQLHTYYSDRGPWAASHTERTRQIEAAHARRLRGRTPPKTTRSRKPLDMVLDALAPFVPVHDPPPGAKVLDFGCGDGKFLNRLQDRGWETYGIEPSTGVPFLRHRRLEILPQDGSFDFVILHHVLEHVAEPLSLLRRVAGSLREGGVLFVSVPRLDTLGQHRDFHYCLNGRTHVVCFSERCLEGLLARAGCAVTAALDRPELDAAQSDGKPLRLRLVATRTATPPALPDAPLVPALNALRQYISASRGFVPRLARRLPVRVRAALMDRAREKSRRLRAGR